MAGKQEELRKLASRVLYSVHTHQHPILCSTSSHSTSLDNTFSSYAWSRKKKDLLSRSQCRSQFQIEGPCLQSLYRVRMQVGSNVKQCSWSKEYTCVGRHRQQRSIEPILFEKLRAFIPNLSLLQIDNNFPRRRIRTAEIGILEFLLIISG